MGGIVDAIGDVVGGAMDVVGDVVGGVVDGVGDVIGGIGDMVEDIIPGGWATVGVGALLAMGIYNPALLGLAEEGALTAEALGAAGLDAAAVAEGAAAVAPEVAAASASAAASGIAPELIAAANLTADPIAALNAAAGWTTADTAYLAAIGATPELIATAEANNAALAAGQTPVSPGSPGQAPVYEAQAGTPGVGAGTADPTLLEGMKSLGKAGLESIGLGNMSATQIAGLMAAGALAPSVLNALGFTGGAGSKGTNYAPIAIPTIPESTTKLAQGGLGPGWISSQPMYQSSDPTQAQFYWGEHPYMAKPEDLVNYNKVPGAPETPWSVRQSSQPAFDVNAFIRNTINPEWQAASAGAAPGLYRPQSTQTAAVGTPVTAPAPVVQAPAEMAPAVMPAPVEMAPVAPVAPVITMPVETPETFMLPSATMPGYPVEGAKVMSGIPLYAADVINAALTPMAIATR